MKAVYISLLVLFLISLTSFVTGLQTENSVLPNAFDWRDHGVVTPAKSQMDCNACGAFASVALFESAIARATGVLVDLSEQEIMDCAYDEECAIGGGIFTGSKYMTSVGLALESVLPFANADCACPAELSRAYILTETVCVPIDGLPLEERIDSMKRGLLEYGPVATNMHADEFFAYEYDGMDVYVDGGESPECGSHNVLVVGWVDDEAIPSGGYWICKNSWGRHWGHGGFFYIAYGEQHVDDYFFMRAVYAPDEVDG